MTTVAPSKSALIREALQTNPNKPASEIAKNVGVSAALVYSVKASLAKKRKPKAGKKKSGRKSEPKNGEINKAERIRQAAKSLGKKVRPRDVIAELAKDGVVVSSAQVSTTLRAAGYRRKRRGRKAAGATPTVKTTAFHLDSLLAAKAFIEKAGGVEQAEAALTALKKLS
jgi:transposase